MENSGSTANGTEIQERVERASQSLNHACYCHDESCRQMSCYKFKRVVKHKKKCKQGWGGTCKLCKALIALCCYHAKDCQNANCLVPFCSTIRQMVAEQKAGHPSSPTSSTSQDPILGNQINREIRKYPTTMMSSKL